MKKYIVRKYIANKVRKYLYKKLNEGHSELVYGLSSYWGSNKGLGRWNSFADAACFVQDRLIREFNYQKCPCCQWATHHPDNHLWCRAQIEARESIVD